MANPNNAIGTNGAFGGRTSPNAFNDVLGAFSGRGVLSGWNVAPNTGMSVVLGGDGENRDVAIAEDNSGNRLTVNNISGIPIGLTIPSAPATNSRIDAVVVYINKPPRGTSSATDNYGAVNILVVSGASASIPVAPSDSDIRTAITADGASGATAYYVVLGLINVASGTTDITGNMITQGELAKLKNGLMNIADGSIGTNAIADGAVTQAKITNDDTGWVDIPYNSGYGAYSADWTSKLQGRVVNGVLYTKGSVASNGTNLTLNTEMDVATIPQVLLAAWNLTSGQRLSAGRCSISGASSWFINPDGRVVVVCSRGASGATVNPTWATIGGCFGIGD